MNILIPSAVLSVVISAVHEQNKTLQFQYQNDAISRKMRLLKLRIIRGNK